MTEMTAKASAFFVSDDLTEAFHEYMGTTGLSKLFHVDGSAPVRYIDQRYKDGRPVPHKAGANGRRIYRATDVIECANDDRRTVSIVATDKMRDGLAEDIDRLHALKHQLTQQTAELQAEIDGAPHRMAIIEKSRELTDETLLTEAEIAKGAMPIPDHCGVYFLLRQGKVVYVGQSVYVASRVASHVSTKDFDSYAFIPCERSGLDILETLYIHLLRPLYNAKADTPTGVVSPIRFSRLMSMGFPSGN